VRYGAQGIDSLVYQQADLIAAKSKPELHYFTAKGNSAGDTAAANFHRAGDTLTWTNPGLTVVTQTRTVGNSLQLTVTCRNTGQETIRSIEYKPMVLHFPRRPRGGSWIWGYDATVDTDGAPGVVVADWTPNKLVLCVEPGSSNPDAADRARGMNVGFAGNFGNTDVNPLVFRTSFEPELPPGKEWVFSASLRMSASQTPTVEIAGDIYKKFQETYPFTLNWPDRRPIGTIFLARSATKWKTNPRGWFNEEKVDVTTPAGKAAFHDRLMQFADGCVQQIRSVGGQGMIFWDLEGEEMPHAISYLGDPRILPQAAPEMDACADEFFKKFAEAGLKTGVCIRPSRIISNGNGGWKHMQVDDHVAELADKIAYGKKRWGCTIFYMDTNVKWPMGTDATRGMWQGNASRLSVSDMRELCRRHPDVLIFPEFGRFGYFGVCGVYGELRGGNSKTGDDVRQVYPQATSVLAVAEGDIPGNWENLCNGVGAGDILLFRGWYGDPVNAHVKRVYQEVDLRKRIAETQTTGPLDQALANSDLAVRYAAVTRLLKAGAGSLAPADAAALVRALPQEKEWVVQGKMVEALGLCQDPSATTLLGELVKDKNKGLDAVAAKSLGNQGKVATPKLLELAQSKDPRISDGALAGLAAGDDPAAIPVLLKLSENQRGWTRAMAARALGTHPGEDTTRRLIALLDDADHSVLIEASKALMQLKPPAAAKPLAQLIVRSVGQLHDNKVREAAAHALEAITGLQYGVFENRWQKALDAGKL
jgi:hypothetical protein